MSANKKIGIITFHSVLNYGALLQAFALQTYLESTGFDIEIINYQNKQIQAPYRIFRVSKEKKLLQNIKQIVLGLRFFIPRLRQKRSFRKFGEKYLNLSKRIYKPADLNCTSYNAIITGSDQVWNPKITNGLDDIYTLNIESRCLKLSYAASVGNDDFIKANETQFVDKLKKIDKISVREETTSKRLSKVLNKNIETTIDPTLLLPKENWANIISNKKKIKEKYIFVYYVYAENEILHKTVEKIAKDTGYRIIYFDEKNKEYDGRKAMNFNCYGPDVFIDLLANAEIVITSSFHGLALSSVFQKELYIVYDQNTNRLKNLVSKLGLESRVVNKIDSLHEMKDVDWASVERKIKKEQSKSSMWLKKALE